MLSVTITSGIGTHGMQCLVYSYHKWHWHSWFTMLSVIITNGIGIHGMQCLVLLSQMALALMIYNA